MKVYERFSPQPGCSDNPYKSIMINNGVTKLTDIYNYPSD